MLKNLSKKINRRRKLGQSLAEYGLILGLIAVVAITALTAMGGQIQGILNQINGALTGAQAGMNPGGAGGAGAGGAGAGGAGAGG